jgi:hypothetical protein
MLVKNTVGGWKIIKLTAPEILQDLFRWHIHQFEGGIDFFPPKNIMWESL